MDERYRCIRYDPTVIGSPYWQQQPHGPSAVANGRVKRHVPPSVLKKKSKDSGKDKAVPPDMPKYLKAYRDKYGSVSAHSTSAIYGALRAPHCHSMYNTSDMWYASVRSLNSHPRELVYPADAYEWRDAAYENAPKEGFLPRQRLHRQPCACLVKRKNPTSARPPPRCRYCANVPPIGGPLYAVPLLPPRVMDKTKLNSVSEEKDEMKAEHVDRMSSYKKRLCGSAIKQSKRTKEATVKEAASASRKSILECDITAYDLIKVPKVLAPPEGTSGETSEQNSTSRYKPRTKKGQSKSKSTTSRIASLLHRNKSSSPKVHKCQSDNNIYGDSSVFIGGQRIVTNYQTMKEPFTVCDSTETTITDMAPVSQNYAKMPDFEESVCIPEPDYDFSDDDNNNDDMEICSTNFKGLKLTYSPPIERRLSPTTVANFADSREISKSMSSLLSEETITPVIGSNSHPRALKSNDRIMYSCCSSKTFYDPKRVLSQCTHSDASNDVNPLVSYEPDAKNVTSPQLHSSKVKYESFSSSDSSSNERTFSSDYLTWTSSSSSEPKSILKKRREDDTPRDRDEEDEVFDDFESKDIHKKQVQFQSNKQKSMSTEHAMVNTSQLSYYSSTGTLQGHMESLKDTEDNFAITDPGENLSSVKSPGIVALANMNNCSDHSEQFYEPTGDEMDVMLNAGETLSETNKTIENSTPVQWTDTSNISPLTRIENETSRTSSLHSSRVLRVDRKTSSLEDIRDVMKLQEAAEDQQNILLSNGKRRATLPRRKLSDLHLHILLCPTRSSLCGDGSSSEDIPLTGVTQRIHRSLPESPVEFDNDSKFRFNFMERNPKDKVLPSSRSTFYVSIGGSSQTQAQEAKCDISNCLDEVNKSTTTTATTTVPSPQINKSSQPGSDDDNTTHDEERTPSPFQDDTDDDNLENEYENLDPIYEELSEISASTRLPSLESPQKSFFEGASKTDILSYLEDAKERGLSVLSEDESKTIPEEDEEEDSRIPTDDEIEKNRIIFDKVQDPVLSEGDEARNSLENIPDETSDEANKTKCQTVEIERNDSGVGTETSKPSRLSKLLPEDSEEQLCADCDHHVELLEDESSGLLYSPLVCRKCELRRCERKEIIIEFVDTEFKYGRDLRIVKEEFYKPMEIAGLLVKEQLLSVFLNLEELLSFNIKFSEKLQDALDIAMEQGDEDYTTVNMGKIFLETSSMLHAFETYCVKQASASVILSNLEKEKELLRIFLRVSQMENTLLRRMNLPAFLMVPVQRVTRYPLLLSRLHKVTPIHHKDRNALKEAQQKVELHLEHINQQTKGVGGAKIWRRISNISASHRRLGNLQDIGSIKLKKMALEILKWKQDEVRFVMAGKLLFTQAADYPWNKKGRTIKFTLLHSLLVALGKPNSNYRPEMAASENPVFFPRNTGIRDASLVLMKEKSGRFATIRDPLFLGNCVISCESETDDIFEIQEYTTKEAYLLKGESKKDTKEWLRQLRYHAKDLGSWRRRRNALANIMINGMTRS